MWAWSPRCPRNMHLLSSEHISRFKSSPYNRRLISVGRAEMDGRRRNDRSGELSSNPKVSKLQETLDSRSDADAWDKLWEQGLTPWDLGGPTPVILNLLKTEALPKGRFLVPGCGSGYDVVAIASPERYVVGIDISDNAILKAIECSCILDWIFGFGSSIAHNSGHLYRDYVLVFGLCWESVELWMKPSIERFHLSSMLPNASYFEFIKADFFNWHPAELFDLIFDYTFFCGIEPSLRSAWACKVRDLLKPDGELVTLMFPVSNHIGGPPYKVSVADYEEVLHPVGFGAISVIDNDLAIIPRKGREKLGRWKRRPFTESCL